MAVTVARRARHWSPLVVYMFVIFYLSSEPDPLHQLTAHVWDKLLHTTEYAVLGLLFCRALRDMGLGWAAAIVLALVATSAYGASDEWHQAFVPTRSSDVHDWFADTLGGTAGAVAYAVGRSLPHFSLAWRVAWPPD